MNNFLDISNIVLYIAVIGNLTLGFVVFAKDFRRSAFQAYFVMTLAIVTWMVTSILVDEPLGRYWQIIMLRIDLAAGMIAGYCLLLFATLFPNRKKFPHKYTLISFFVLTALLSVASLWGSLIVRSVTIEGSDLSYTPGILDIPYMLVLLTMLVLSIKTLYRQYKESVGYQKLQVQYMLVGLIIPVLIIISTTVLLARLIDWNIIDVGNSAKRLIRRIAISGTTYFFLVSAFAIIKHHLFGIRIILGKIIFWLLIGGFYGGLFWVIQYLDSNVTGVTLSFNTIFISLFFVFLTAFIFSAVEKAIREQVTRRLVGIWNDPDQITESFIIKASSQVTREELIELLFDTTRNALHVESQAIFIVSQNESGKQYWERYWDNVTPAQQKKCKEIKDMSVLMDLGMQGYRSFYGYKENADTRKNQKEAPLLFEKIVPFYHSSTRGAFVILKREGNKTFTVDDQYLLENLMFYFSINLARLD